MNNEATYRFAFAATRRFAGPTKWAVVRELNASGYPLHLPLSYMGELPNSHGRTSTGKSYDIHGIRTSFRFPHLSGQNGKSEGRPLAPRPFLISSTRYEIGSPFLTLSAMFGQ